MSGNNLRENLMEQIFNLVHRAKFFGASSADTADAILKAVAEALPESQTIGYPGYSGYNAYRTEVLKILNGDK